MRSAGVRHQGCQSEEAAVLGHRLRTLPDMPSLAPGPLLPPGSSLLGLAASAPGCSIVQRLRNRLVHSLSQRGHGEEARKDLLVLRQWDLKAKDKIITVAIRRAAKLIRHLPCITHLYTQYLSYHGDLI